MIQTYQLFFLFSFILFIECSCNRSKIFMSNFIKFPKTLSNFAGITIGIISSSYISSDMSTFASITLTPNFDVQQVLAKEDSSKLYKNDIYHSSFSYPSQWIKLEGILSGDRIIDAFVDPNDKDTSVSIVYSPIPGDFNKLGSFGGKESLKLFILPSGDDIKTKVISESVQGETFRLDYLLDAPNIPTKHVQSLFALKPAELVYALNVQVNEDAYNNQKDLIDAIIPSFKYDIER